MRGYVNLRTGGSAKGQRQESGRKVMPTAAVSRSCARRLDLVRMKTCQDSRIRAAPRLCFGLGLVNDLQHISGLLVGEHRAERK